MTSLGEVAEPSARAPSGGSHYAEDGNFQTKNRSDGGDPTVGFDLLAFPRCIP
jgi:hypothetical protein